ncbi:MAG: metallophosphoesterase [Phycisphaerae bacterium]|nr:MAG: YmdB family metallophosphoesterase [Planctomycetia bacterium]RIK70754.1 MAG: metallophosphoesterase [Planctomycetota bacterium]GJQ27213.1 MAG: metallophosphoesterase [Phycisphaerae bacterium]
MEITLLCIGDVVGRPGRSVVSQAIPRIVKERGVDCVIANVENAAAGSGLTEVLYHKFMRYGVHLMTVGDHIYRRAEILPVLERCENIVRPANYPAESVGHEVAIYETAKGPRVALFSLMGRLFMKPPCDCAFHAADRMLARIPPDVKITVVDMHAEATSEKVAMGWHLAGRASVVFGTHTHVPTADERILNGGTAYITDLGMSGPYDSVLGRRKDRVMRSMITGLPCPFDVATGDARMCGILVNVESETGKATHIERVCIHGPEGGHLEPEEGNERD